MKIHYKVEMYSEQNTKQSSTFPDLLQHLTARASITEDISLVKIHDMKTKTIIELNENSFKDKVPYLKKNRGSFLQY